MCNCGFGSLGLTMPSCSGFRHFELEVLFLECLSVETWVQGLPGDPKTYCFRG